MMSKRYRLKLSIHGKEWESFSEKDSFILGRGLTADIVVNDDLLSRQHLRISHSNNRHWIEDLGSINGTWMGMKRLPPNQKVSFQPGQQFYLAKRKDVYFFVYYEEVAAEVVDISSQEVTMSKVANGVDSQPIPKEGKIIPLITQKGLEEQLSETEQDLFVKIKNMLSSEATSLKKSAVVEAESIISNARCISEEIIEDAKKEADKIFYESTHNLQDRIRELELVEVKKIQKNDELELDRTILEEKIRELTLEEEKIHHLIFDSQDHLNKEEERALKEKELLELRMMEISETKNKLDSECEKLKLQERKIKAQIEEELLESNFKISQIKGELGKLEEQKKYLIEQVNVRHIEKRGIEAEYIELKRSLDSDSSQLIITQNKLEAAVKELQEAKAETKRQNELFKEYQENAFKVWKEAELKSQEAQELFKRAEEKAANITYDARKELQNLIHEKEVLKEELEVQRENGTKELKTKLYALELEHKTHLLEIESEHKKVVSDLLAQKANLDQFINEKKIMAEREIDELKRNTTEYCEEIKNAAEARIFELENKRREFEMEISEIRGRRDMELEQTRVLSNEIVDHSRHEANEIMLKARSEALEWKETQSSILEEELQLRRKDAEVIILKAEEQAKEIHLKAEREFQDLKKEQERVLAEFKIVEMSKLKQMRLDLEEELVEKRNLHAKNVANNVYGQLASEMLKGKDKVMSSEFIEEFSSNIKDLVKDTVLGKIGPDNDKLQLILKTKGSTKAKEKLYWKRLGIIGGGAFLFIVLLIIFPQIIIYPKNAIVAAFTNKGETHSDIYLEQVKEARKNAVYRPATTVEYKDSYVDNVLYTTDYLMKLENKDFQDKRILDLNDYFIKVLDVKDTTIIKFVSLESTLIKDLLRLRDQIDPATPELKIEEMRTREKEFKQRLSEVFEDPTKVNAFYQFTAKFWHDFYHSKKIHRP